jgi:hypothetical protein
MYLFIFSILGSHYLAISETRSLVNFRKQLKNKRFWFFREMGGGPNGLDSLKIHLSYS